LPLDKTYPTSGTLRVFKLFAWLEVDSVKIALPRLAHLPVTQAVGRLGRYGMKTLSSQGLFLIVDVAFTQ